ncbi:hypothetical protein ACH0AH_14550 [Microbacterium paludicola]|uniref:hypothetical protein n=1 Tax=Microbacterium paludicola TaxID=300019 RepID=UPI003879477C
MQNLSEGVLAYVGYDGDAAVPGRCPSRVDDAIGTRVREVISYADEHRPGEGEELFEWANRVSREVGGRFPELDEQALIAIRALVSFEWR